MSSKNELNKKLFDEFVKKGYAEYKTVNKSTEMFRTDKWKNEADQIYKKIEKLFNEEYYPSTITDSAKQSQAIASLPTQEEQVNDLPTQESVENVQQMKYNENRGEENGKIQFGGVLEGNNEPSRIYEENKPTQTRGFTKSEYERFEKSITPIPENKITEVGRNIIQKYKIKYDKNIVLFDGNENSGFGGGASLTDKNKIYIDINEAKEFGYNMIASHEVMESDILYNKELKSDIIDDIVRAIIDDPNFKQQKIEFWEGQKGNMPLDYLIAKDIICDRFAELDNNEALSYKNVLSPETNMTLDFGIDNFRNKIKNNQADTESAFSMPKNKLETQADKLAKLDYINPVEDLQRASEFVERATEKDIATLEKMVEDVEKQPLRIDLQQLGEKAKSKLEIKLKLFRMSIQALQSKTHLKQNLKRKK